MTCKSYIGNNYFKTNFEWQVCTYLSAVWNIESSRNFKCPSKSSLNILFNLFSSQSDVKEFLLTLNLDKDNYQIGMSKIFMRESEKLKLDYRLHQQIMAGIVTIQRWFRALMERRRFLRLKQAVIQIQVSIFKRNFASFCFLNSSFEYYWTRLSAHFNCKYGCHHASVCITSAYSQK